MSRPQSQAILRIMLATILMTGAFPLLAADNDRNPKLPSYTLPDDPKAPVIVYDSLGGMIARKTQEPIMQILADGTVELGNPWGMSRKIESKITVVQLQQLLHFLIETNKFFDADAAAIKAAVQQKQQEKGSFIAIADAGTVKVGVNLKEKKHEVSYYALNMMAGQFPDIKSLQQLSAISKKLNFGMNWIRAGRKEGVEAALALANAELKAKFPHAEPLKASDLTSAYENANGRRGMHFSRSTKGDNGQVASYVNAQLVWMPGEDAPKVTVNAKVD